MSDIVLEKNTNGLYDILFENGDFKLTDGLDTAILMSLLIDKRADESEVFEPELRRGWIGNEQNEDEDYDIGSKLWLIYQARANQNTLNRAIDYAKDGLIWMINDGLIKDVQVTGEIENENIILTVNFIRFDNSILTQQFNLWENTTIA